MNRTARAVAILVTMVAALAGVVPAANASGVPLPSPVDQLVNRVSIGGGSTCVPKPVNHIYELTYRVYNGTADTLYYISDLGETWANCPPTVTITVQLSDQALDGSSLPANGDAAKASGRGGASQTAGIVLDFPNVVLATAPQHMLTMLMTASQTNGTVTTTWCAVRRWTYFATLAGPADMASTGTQDCG